MEEERNRGSSTNCFLGEGPGSNQLLLVGTSLFLTVNRPYPHKHVQVRQTHLSEKEFNFYEAKKILTFKWSNYKNQQ